MDYEEYMRNVLGYNQMPNNIYTNTYDDYYYDTQYIRNDNNTENFENMYPEIYKIVYPMVSKICIQNNQREITKELLDNMTEEIYSNIEPEERQNPINSMSRPILKNGDVRNPNVKEPETRGETRQNNFLLRDLIRILILRELGKPIRPRPPMPPPRPPRPSRPPQTPYYNQRPPWRPY